MARSDLKQTEFVDFYLPFGGKLSAENRWVKLAEMIPWKEVEAAYQKSLSDSGIGAPAKSSRIAFGALIIKERLTITDEEVVEQILENPYLQYFLGLHQYCSKPLFDPSMMVHFRSRFAQSDYEAINAQIIEKAVAHDSAGAMNKNEEAPDDQDHDGDPPAPLSHSGKLLIDASCAPADITYPTDLKLLGEVREKTEAYLDKLHEPFIGQRKKPRTYRQKARRQFLTIAKQKKPGAKKIRKAIRQQLGYLRRNLGHIGRYCEPGALGRLIAYEIKCLQVIHTLYQQQLYMYENHRRSVADRIVSISQPHVRPMVRGKAGKKVEFGAKFSISHLAGGYVTLHRLSWDAYNEGGDLIGQIESYRDRFGCYPESVHADTIYRTRENRSYCQQHGVRLSGPPLGRPPKETEQNQALLKERKRQTHQDELDRIPVEGKFGNAKRKGTLNRVMAKLAHTSVSVINVSLIVLNLDTWLRRIFWGLYGSLQALVLELAVLLSSAEIRFWPKLRPS